MPWFKVDDTLAFHAKVIAAGNAAMGLWVRAGSWSSQQTSEGFVPLAIAKTLGTTAEAQVLVRVRLWVEVDGGYVFHEWLERNPSREKVIADRAAAAERQRVTRERAAASRRDKQALSQRDSRSDNGVSHGPPVPSRPVPVLGSVTSSSDLSDAGEKSTDDDGPNDETLTAWAEGYAPATVDVAAEAAAFRRENAGRWHQIRNRRAAWRGWLAKAAERNRPTPTPGTPECPIHPGRPTGSKACPDCAAEATPAPNLRALRGAS
jgi:hypothetical protein